MLQETNGGIYEGNQSISNFQVVYDSNANTGDVLNSGIYQPQPYWYWGTYPVYVCTNKMKKAIDVLKALEADKLVKLTSVKSFIALVEKIAGLL